MAELLLSAFLDVLLDRLLSPELLKFAGREGLRKQLDKWGKTMKRIRKVLDDAEEKQHIQPSVKDWLDDLKDLAYDVEDILDEFATEAALRRTLMAAESQASASMIVQKTDAGCCNFLLLSENWMCEDPKLRPTFTEIMVALKPLQKPITSSQVPRPSTSTGSGRQKALPSQTAEEAG